MATVEGQAEAFCSLEFPRLVRALAAYTGDQDVAVELAQEAMARVCLHWKKVRNLDAPTAWAHRVAVNLANSHLRRTRYERAAWARAAAQPPAGQGDALEPVPEWLSRALRELPARQREAVVLRFVLDLSVTQTAEHMRCAPGTVRALTAQGVARLRQNPELAELQEPHHA